MKNSKTNKKKVVFLINGYEVRIHRDKRKNLKSSANYNYKNSKRRKRRARHYIYINEKPVWLHCYLANKYIRKLKKGDIVHHEDGNTLNNSLENLEIMTRAEHIREHKPVKGYKFTLEQRKRLSDSHKDQKAWNKGMKGFKHTEIAKLNMSNAQKGRKITWGRKISIAKYKVTKGQVLRFLRKNPTASGENIQDYFNLETHQAIRRLGGMRKLRKKLDIDLKRSWYINNKGERITTYNL